MKSHLPIIQLLKMASFYANTVNLRCCQLHYTENWYGYISRICKHHPKYAEPWDVETMTKENKYYYCTTCRHIHLTNSEIGRLHMENSAKIQGQKKEMELVEKGMGVVDFGLEKRITQKKLRKLSNIPVKKRKK